MGSIGEGQPPQFVSPISRSKSDWSARRSWTAIHSISPTEPPVLFAQTVYCLQSARSVGVPVISPPCRVSPAGKSGWISQVSISGPLLVTEICTLWFECIANWSLGHQIWSGGRLVILNCSMVEAKPPELFAQTVWDDQVCSRVAIPLILPV